VSPLDRDDEDARRPEPTQTCTAFPLPSGIPAEIWWNRTDHRQPVDGDHNIQWQARDGADFPEWAMSREGGGDDT
jgi:hypothetical protein